MSGRNDGGAAFPVFDGLSAGRDANEGNFTIYGSDGMTLRDYFAAKAMQGIAASSLKYNDTAEAARDAYRIADAMIAERAK